MAQNYILQTGDNQEYSITLDSEELAALGALAFIERASASLELFRLYQVIEGNRFFLEIADPTVNSSIIQIFPTSQPYEAYLRRYPSGNGQEFLNLVSQGKSPGIESMDLGPEYRKNFSLPVVLMVWGFPSAKPEPAWNGLSLLVHMKEKGRALLEELLTIQGFNPADHLKTFSFY